MTARDEVRRRVAGLYTIADAQVSAGDPVGLAVDALQGGCRLLQLRCKDWSPDDVLLAARELVSHGQRYGATILVNDDPEIAAAAGADGVHLGQLDGPTQRARKVMGMGAIVGRSTGDLEALRLAASPGEEGADYIAFGPVFPTPHLSRPKAVRGLEMLREARTLLSALRGDAVPLVAIGGITRERLAEVKATGASAWAVIGAIALADDPVEATRALL